LFANHDRANRHFFPGARFLGEAQRFTHEDVVRLHAFNLTRNQDEHSDKKYGRAQSAARNKCASMKPLSLVLIVFSLSLISVNATEQDIVDRSAGTIREFRHMPEKGLPPRILRRARGLAIISVVKAGFIFSGKAGEGVVVARTGHGWSGPSFIGTGGAGWGPQIGAQVTDFVIVLNSDRAVAAFSKGGNITLGADASVAAGPVGRAAEADVTPRAAIYTYSKTKGLFIGASLEGAVIATRKGANEHYYGRPVTASDVLSGRVNAPPRAASLRTVLR
jgi:SH3 domain-containing YSC84-like protein 1